MFNRKTSIPNLLGAALALTGCRGDEPFRPQSVVGIAQEAFCMKMKTCDPVYRYEPCLDNIFYWEFASQYLAEPCASLFASYFECFTALPCNVLLRIGEYGFMDEGEKACEEQFYADTALVDLCYAMLP